MVPSEESGAGRRPVTHPEFFERVVEQSPTPLFVLDNANVIVYANRAMKSLLGLPADEVITATGDDLLLPEDRSWASAMNVRFKERIKEWPLSISSDEEAAMLPPVFLRMMTANGVSIPVEVIPAGPIADDVLGGVVYQVRPAHQDEMLTNILAGIADGAHDIELLRLVTQIIAMPPLGLDAAVLERTPSRWRVLTSTTQRLTEALEAATSDTFETTADSPRRCRTAELGDSLGSALHAAGYHELWYLSLDSEVVVDPRGPRYEIVACPALAMSVAPAIDVRLRRAGELARLVLKRAENDRRLEVAARRDGLTGLLNRTAFRADIDAALESSTPSGSTAPNTGRPWLIFLDLDGFKPINDTHGHAAGDAVLRVVAGRISSAVRGHDVVARIGGDEFAVLLANDDHPSETKQAIADRIVVSIGQPIDIGEASTPVSVTASAGLAVIGVNDDVDSVLKRADRLMYEAKRSGGGQLRVEDLAD